MPAGDLDKWQLLRSKIVHEDTWSQQRVNWLLAIDGFLLVGMASLAPYALAPVGKIQSILLPFMGLLTSIFVLAGLVAANKAMEAVVDELKLMVPTAAARKKLPSLRSTEAALTFGRVSHWGITIASLLVWLTVLVLFAAGYPGPLKG